MSSNMTGSTAISGQNKMMSNTGGFGGMMTQGQSMHAPNNLMGGSNQGMQQQPRGYSPSKSKWK